MVSGEAGGREDKWEAVVIQTRSEQGLVPAVMLEGREMPRGEKTSPGNRTGLRQKRRAGVAARSQA